MTHKLRQIPVDRKRKTKLLFYQVYKLTIQKQKSTLFVSGRNILPFQCVLLVLLFKG